MAKKKLTDWGSLSGDLEKDRKKKEEQKPKTQTSQIGTGINNDWSLLTGDSKTDRSNIAKRQEEYKKSASAYQAQLDSINRTSKRSQVMMQGFHSDPVKQAQSEAEYHAKELARNAPIYQQISKEARKFSDYGTFNAAQSGLRQSSGNFADSYERYQQASQKAREDYLANLKQTNKSQYYGETLNREQIEGQIRMLERQRDEIEPQVREAEKAWGGAEQTIIDGKYTDAELLYKGRSKRLQEIEDELATYQSALGYRMGTEADEIRQKYAPDGRLTAEAAAKRAAGEKKYQADKQASVTAADVYLNNNFNMDTDHPFGAPTNTARRDALLENGYVSDLEDARHLSKEDQDIFYALYADDPEKAREWIHITKTNRDEQYQRYLSRLVDLRSGNTLWDTGAVFGGWLAGTGANIAAGVTNLVDPFSETALELSRTGQALLAGGAQMLNREIGTIDENIPFIGNILGGKGLGDLYTLASSMAESQISAVASAGAGKLSEAVQALGVVIMGSSAAAADYDEMLKRGLTEQQARQHAFAAGINEAAFEWLSLDKLVNPDFGASAIKQWLTQSGIEASEEFCTTIANRLTDGILARRDGYDTQIEQRMKELIALGVDHEAAKEQAEHEWTTDLINDALGGFISGGGNMVMNQALGYSLSKFGEVGERLQAQRNASAQFERQGAMLRQSNQTAALAQYAKDNNLTWTEAEQRAEAVNQSESGTGETDSSTALRSAQNDVSQSTLGQQVAEAGEQQKTRKEAKQQARQNRAIGIDAYRVQEHIQEQFAGKTVQQQEAIRDELVKKYGAGMELPVYRAVSMETAKQAMELESTDAIRHAREAVLAEIQNEDMKRAVAEGYDQAAYQKAAQSNDLNAAAKYIQQVRNTGRGGMSMTATVTGEDGQSRQVRIADMTEDGKGVKLEDGTVVAAKDLVADADTMDVVKQLARLNLGRDASAVLNAYRDSGVAESEGYRWIMDYATAYEQGRTARISLKQAVERSSLDAKTVMDAYQKGQQYALAETEKAEERKNKARKKGVTGRKSNIDTSELTRKGITYEKMTEAERQQYDLANKIFELIGVDLKWIASDLKTDSKGQEYYSGVNGSYLNGVVTLDIHAGQNYVEALRSGVLATTGHELTHFLEQYAPKQYKALKEFVFQQIVENSANGEQTLERMIWEKQKRSNFRISAREAEHEVIADACQEMLLDSEAIREFAAENEEAAKGMVRWLRDFFAKIKAAFKQSTELTEQARFMAGLEKDVRKAFGKLWDEALREAVQTHREVGNLESSQEQNSDRDVTTMSDKERKSYLFNQQQTETGSKLKTMGGSDIQRSTKYGIGKEIGGRLYVHEQYAEQVIPSDVYEQAKQVLAETYPDFEYNCVEWSPKDNVVRFDEAPGFDTEREPAVGDYVTVKPDGTTTKGHTDYIWHHKWQWVANDYKGFDVRQSWEWSKQWLSTINGKTYDVNGKQYNDRGKSDGNGLGRWNAQLEAYGLPLDQDGTRYSERPEQEFSSEDTSMPQTARTFTEFKFNDGDRILDYGGGQYNIAKEAVERAYGNRVTLDIVDAFNRTDRHNRKILSQYEEDPADAVTVNNVLNVIKEPNIRLDVARTAKSYVKPGGIVYFCFFEGTGDTAGSGEGAVTKQNKGNVSRSNYQTKMPMRDYIPELKQAFKYVEPVGAFLLASDEPITKDRYTRLKAGDAISKSIKDYSSANKKAPSFRYGESSISEIDERYLRAATVDPETGEYDSRAVSDIVNHIANREGLDEKTKKRLLKVEYDAKGNIVPISQRVSMDEENFIRYSFRGENAKTANLTMLQQAEKMLEEGKDSETVRKETGWFKGMDGKWRYEVDDRGLRFDPGGDITGRRKEIDARIKAYKEARSRLYEKDEENKTEEEHLFDGFEGGMPGEVFQNIIKYRDAVENEKPRNEKKYYNILKNIIGDKFTAWADDWAFVTRYERFNGAYFEQANPKILDDYVDAEDLFAAYPELRHYKFRWADLGNGTYGYHNPTSREIVLNNSLRDDPEKTKSTLLHEIQHAVQEIEGFARGATPDYWRINHDARMTKLTKQVQSLSKSLDDMYADIGYEEYYNDLERRTYVDEEITPEEMDRLLDEYVKEHSPNYGYPLLQQYKKALAAYHEAQKDGTPFEMYQRTAGEIESRDVQNRMKFTDEERRNNRPDIDRKDVVFTENANVTLDVQSESAAPGDGTLFSERTWTASRFVQDRENAAKALAKALDVTQKQAEKYIDDINSVAKAIADDRARLDYMSSPGRSAFKSNAEYGGSIDFSTLCKKRQLLTGTFNAIQHALANTMLTAEDVLRVRQMMQDAGLEVNCGMCYVEGSRARMGEYNKTFLELYKKYFPDNWQPKMEDVNTTDGLELMRMEHPEAYEQYEHFYNNHGTLRSEDKAIFSSQAKPKEYQLRTEYKGEIKDKFQNETNVEAKNRNGGMRMQSFSDFEIVHLIDCMQVIMDMSEVGLAGQAYTKVPEFAEALGRTGLKINLSLVAKGVDENGKLIFNDVEGMPHERAFGIREKYSENVGTILVVYDDAQLTAAMADDKVDFIIPFHRSQWRKSQYAAMGLPKTTKDYTYQQNEKWLNPKEHTHKYRDKVVPTKCTNYMPNEYWDFSLSGTENARRYLEMCAKDGKRPKFYKLLQNNGDGSFSLKADGSTDGYWKLLIDFKMYDNDGVGVPQMPVQPIFDMDNAMQMLADYSGDPSKFPVAQGVVDEFVSQYKADHPGRQYSERDYDQISDLDLMDNAVEGLTEAGGEEYWNALLESAPELASDKAEIQSLAKTYREQAEKLAKAEAALEEAKRQMKPGGDRKLKTKGISSLALDIMKSVHAGDVHNKQVAKNVAQILAQAYQKGLNAIDAGKDPGAVWDIVYSEGVEKAADFMLENATYSEKFSYKWVVSKLGDYLKGEDGRWSVIDAISAKVIMDWSQNRMRQRMEATQADKLIERTENRMQKQIDEAKARAKTAENRNAELEENVKFLKQKQEENAGTIEHLGERLEEARKELKESKGKSAKEQKAALDKAKRLNERLQAKKQEAAAWKKLADQQDKLATQYGEKQAALLKKLQAQVDRERRILEGKLKPPAMQRLLKAERERAAKEAEQHKDEVFANYKERQRQGDLRQRIRNLSDEMKRRMTNPSERAYVPASLYESMTRLADLLDDVLSPKPGTKAAAKYRAMMDAIHGLAREYSAVKDMDDPTYSSEYDTEIQDAISEIERVLERKDASWLDELTGDTKKGLRELSTGELQRIYELMRSINYSMVGATAMLGHSGFKNVFDAMRSVVDQQNGMESLNSLGKVKRWNRQRLLDNLSVMRAVEMMSGWERDAALYQLMHNIEQGTDESWSWVMDYNKSLQDLKTGKNEKEYRDALTKKLDFGVTDEEGRKVLMTKMQALQILMTAEREAHNDKLLHLQTGGAVIRDAIDLQNGKGAKSRSQTVKVTPELIRDIQNGLTDWDRAYMKAIRSYFQKEGRRTNEILYKLKHKVLQTEDYYVPYNVDANYLETRLDENQAMNMWVKTPGSTNALKQKAKQPVIIDGMDTVMARHVKEIADYIGLAIPIRDFSKVFNGRLATGEDNPLPVKKTIDRTFGAKGQHLLTQAVIDVQGGSQHQNWSSGISDFLSKLQGAFVKSALLINPSVTIKQAASYIAAESVLSHRALVAGNRALFSSDEAKSPALIAYLFSNPEGRTAKRIYNEIDQHTSLHYQRRLGMSQAEIAEQANRNGPVKRWMNGIGASMEQNALGHAVRKAGENLNPVTWIQRMDVATTAALWVACKEQAKMDLGITDSSPAAQNDEYWKHTTELYERVLRETQPMYDGLHRTAHQKQAGGLVQFLFPFRTVPIQNHGQLAASYEALKASKGKSKARQAAAKKFFAKTVWAQTESAVVFSVMTFLAALLKRKTKKYRDEDEEFTAESFAKGLMTDVGSTLFSVLQPMYGSELVSLGSRAMDKFEGSSGYTYDAFSVGVVDMINDLASSGDKLFADTGKLMRGEDVSFEDFRDHVLAMLTKGAKLAGIPADTVKTYAQGLMGNIEDIRAGRIPAINDESWDRATAVNANRFYKAWLAGDREKMRSVLSEVNSSGKSDESIANAFNARVKEAYENNEIGLEQYDDYLDKTSMFDTEKSATKIKNLVKEEFVNGERSEDDTIRVLTEICGMDGDKAWKTVQQWEAKAEHADEEEYSYSQYEDLREALDAGKSLQEAGAEYLEHGYSEKQIADAAVDHLRDRFAAGEISEDEAIRLYSAYKGKDENEAWKKVQEWAAKAEHADDEDYSYSQYDAIDEAIAANKDIKSLVKELTDHGVEEKNISSHVKGYLVERYVAGGVSETALKNQLSRYLGIVAKDDVDKILNDANSKKQYGVNYSSLDEEYRAGNIKASEMKNALMKYGGLSAADADKKIRWYDLQKANPSLEISESKANTWYDGTAYTKTNGHESAKAAGMSIQEYLRAKDELANVKGVDANNDGRTDTGSREIAYIRVLTAMSWLTDRQRRALYYEEYKGTSKTSKRPW